MRPVCSTSRQVKTTQALVLRRWDRMKMRLPA